MQELFRIFSQKVSEVTGSSWAFLTALAVIIVWAVSGPIFGFSDTWQLVINTGTTIITFLMVFLIQNTQNRDAKALHLKLDALIKANQRAENAILDAEDLPDEEMARLKKEIDQITHKHGHSS